MPHRVGKRGPTRAGQDAGQVVVGLERTAAPNGCSVITGPARRPPAAGQRSRALFAKGRSSRVGRDVAAYAHWPSWLGYRETICQSLAGAAD